MNTPSREDHTGLLAWMARNSIAANLLMLLLLGGGVWTALNIQKEVFPQFQLDIVEVSVGYPGAAPAEVEQGIRTPLSHGALDRYARMRVTTVDGTSLPRKQGRVSADAGGHAGSRSSQP